MDQVAAVKEAISIAGSQLALGELVGAAQATVSHWVNRDGRISAEFALKCAIATGVSVHDLRPDLYPRGEVVIKRRKRQQ